MLAFVKEHELAGRTIKKALYDGDTLWLVFEDGTYTAWWLEADCCEDDDAQLYNEKADLVNEWLCRTPISLGIVEKEEAANIVRERNLKHAEEALAQTRARDLKLLAELKAKYEGKGKEG